MQGTAVELGAADNALLLTRCVSVFVLVSGVLRIAQHWRNPPTHGVAAVPPPAAWCDAVLCAPRCRKCYPKTRSFAVGQKRAGVTFASAGLSCMTRRRVAAAKRRAMEAVLPRACRPIGRGAVRTWVEARAAVPHWSSLRVCPAVWDWRRRAPRDNIVGRSRCTGAPICARECPDPSATCPEVPRGGRRCPGVPRCAQTIRYPCRHPPHPCPHDPMTPLAGGDLPPCVLLISFGPLGPVELHQT